MTQSITKAFSILSATTELSEDKKTLPLWYAPFAVVQFDVCIKIQRDRNIPDISAISSASISVARNR